MPIVGEEFHQFDDCLAVVALQELPVLLEKPEFFRNIVFEATKNLVVFFEGAQPKDGVAWELGSNQFGMARRPMDVTAFTWPSD